MPKYSIIIPVFNRPVEMQEMLDSLQAQTLKHFEVIIVEDGSTKKSDFLVSRYDLKVHYFYKPNSGPGDSRNFGMKQAKGDYLLFFDSDCVLPNNYFEKLDQGLLATNADAFGGPDAAHESFSNTQKAINYSMTSFLTTGGIRGGKRQLDTYQPRSFNMGFSRKVYEIVGGFADIHPGEDPDLSFRIMNAGFKIALISDAFVYHKRRINFGKFIKQVYKFGVVRVILNKWHPKTKKLVYFLPSLFLIGVSGCLLTSIFVNQFALTPLVFYSLLVFISALISTKNIIVSLLSVPASFCQLLGYGYGFLDSWATLVVSKRPERTAFPSFFFKKKTPDSI